MSEIKSVKCDRCGRRVDVAEGLSAWARITYQYHTGGGVPMTWDLCPNCRLLYEAAMIELRMMGTAKNKTQFALEVDLAKMAEGGAQCPGCGAQEGAKHHFSCPTFLAPFCEHANESPQSRASRISGIPCPCPAGCYCRGRTCPP